MSALISVLNSCVTSSLRSWRGTASFKPRTQRPEKLLQLYDIENCPYCRLVRESLCELDIDVLILPCPRGGQRFRPEARSIGGKAQFPLLIDPNTQVTLYESRDIINYLRTTYGGRKNLKGGVINKKVQELTSSLASATRLGHGMRKTEAKSCEQTLELYSFESSPYSRLVRERLCELELPYILRNTGKAMMKDMGPPQWRKRFFPDLPVEGRNRLKLLEMTGKVQVPYLVDPNTGQQMYESQKILAYLDTHYAS